MSTIHKLDWKTKLIFPVDGIMTLKLISIILILCQVSRTIGFLQQLILHESIEEDGNYYIISEHVPDSSVFNLQNVQRICYRGAWSMYLETDFVDYATGVGTIDLLCVNEQFQYKSMRYGGSNDTQMAALSLYSGMWEGDEIYIDQPQFTISLNQTQIKSLGYTGTSSWTLFEGTNFNGTKVCLVPNDQKPFGWFVTADNFLTAIGSGVQGCD